MRKNGTSALLTVIFAAQFLFPFALEAGRTPAKKTGTVYYIKSVPYKSQRDNAGIGSVSCNATSVSMVMQYYLKTPVDSREFYYKVKDACGYPGDPNALACGVNKFYPSLHDTANLEASIEQIKSSIRNGNPVVVHGYFTYSGHVVVIIGYDDNGYWVHDPYGRNVMVDGVNDLYYSEKNALGCVDSGCAGYSNYFPKYLFELAILYDLDLEPYWCTDSAGRQYKCAWAHFISQRRN